MVKVTFSSQIKSSQGVAALPDAVELRLASVSWQTLSQTSSSQERYLRTSEMVPLRTPSQEVSLGASHVAGEVGLTHHQVGEAVERAVFNNNIMFLMKP